MTPRRPDSAPSTGARRRRSRITVLVAVAMLEIVGVRAASSAPSFVAETTPATAGIEQIVDAATDPSAEAVAVSRPASPLRLLAAELATPRSVARTRPVLNADQAFDRRPSELLAPDAASADDAPAEPSPANAGDETTAAAGGLAGAGRAAAVVPQRLRIAELGVDNSILEFPCDRSQPPDDFVYAWGCAGRDNLYLLGHAYSVFEALHDAYVDGALHVGMTAVVTGDAGESVTYRVTTWRLVRPDQVEWAIADQPVPSMTLQTCYGPKSELRLLVRLVADA